MMARSKDDAEGADKTMKPFITTAVVSIVAALFLVPRVWNPVETGPDIANPQAFFGCYGSLAKRVTVNSTDATVPSQGKKTKIKRYLLLKDNAVINTVNNLQIDDRGRSLSIGKAGTGFYYKFNDDTRPTAIIIPDDRGVERLLPRVRC